MGTSKLIESVPLYRSEVPEKSSRLVVQGLQIGGTGANLRFSRPNSVRLGGRMIYKANIFSEKPAPDAFQ